MRWRSGSLAFCLLLSCAGSQMEDKLAPPRSTGPVDVAVSVDELEDRMFLAESQNRLDEALSLAEQVVARLRARGDKGKLAIALENKGRFLRILGRWGEAVPVLREGLVVALTDADRASLLFHLGTALSLRREDEEAIAVLRQSLALYEQVDGPGSISAVSSAESLASALGHAGRYEEGEPLFQRVVAAREKSGDPLDLGRALLNRALNLTYLGRTKEAAALYERSIALLELTTGFERAVLAEAHSGRAEVMLAAGKLEAAEAGFRQALKTRLDALGPEHPMVGLDHHNLAIVLKERGRYREALAACEQAQLIRAKALESDHPFRQGTESLCAELRTKASKR